MKKFVTNPKNIETRTSSFTLMKRHSGKLISINSATANNVTVPSIGDVSWILGDTIDLLQYGLGQTTIVGGSGVTILANNGNVIMGSPGEELITGRLTCIDTNTWLFENNLNFTDLTGFEVLANKVTDFTSPNDSDYPTTQAVSDLVVNSTGSILSEFLFITASDISTYYKLGSNPSTGSSQSITKTNVTAGEHSIAKFVTEPNNPNKTFISVGWFRSHFYAKKSINAGTINIYAKVYQRNLVGTETLIATFPLTDVELPYTASEQYDIETYNDTIIPLLVTDRIVIEYIAVNSTNGSPDVTLYFENSYYSRFDLPVSNYSLGFTPEPAIPNGTINQFWRGDKTWQSLSFSVPQANKIYIDSTNGVDSAGRGRIDNPYLTVEYALSDITNTGTFTATTTSGSNTLTAVSSTTNIKIGQKITGLGIPYGSTVESFVTNTSIVISQNATSSNSGITVSWWNEYWIIFNGSLVTTSNLYKQGFNIVNEGSISFGNCTLLNCNTEIPVIPYCFINNGIITGTHANSKLYYENTGISTNIHQHIFNIEMGNYTSIGSSGYAVEVNRYDSSPYYGKYTITSNKFVNCKAGRISKLRFINNAVQKLNGYGLLEGTVMNYCYSSISDGDLESSATALAFGGAFNRAIHNGNIKGNVELGDKSIVNGYIQGLTTSTIGAQCKITAITGGTFTVSGSSPYYTQTVIDRAEYCTITSGGFACSLVVNSAKTTYFDMTSGGNFTVGGGVQNYNIENRFKVASGILNLLGGHYCYSTNYMLISGTGRLINNGAIHITGVQSMTGGEFINNGEIYAAMPLYISGGLFINNNIIDKSNDGTIYDYKSIIQSGGTIVNKGIMIGNTLNATIPIIEKSAGKFINETTGSFRVSNGAGPIRCSANTSASKDVQYFGGHSNCDGITYGMLIAFDGTSYIPNNIVTGVVLYENTAYGY